MALVVSFPRRSRRSRRPFASTSFVLLTLLVAACSDAGGGGGATGVGGLAGIRDMGVPVGGQANWGTAGRETLPDAASNGGDAPYLPNLALVVGLLHGPALAKRGLCLLRSPRA